MEYGCIEKTGVVILSYENRMMHNINTFVPIVIIASMVHSESMRLYVQAGCLGPAIDVWSD